MMKRVLKWTGFILLTFLIGGLIAGWTPDTDPAAMRAKYANAASQFIDVGDGLRVHVRDEGNRTAPAIVLLHGSNDSLQTWDPWVAKLQSSYRVIRLDLPGHGLTGPHPKGDYSNAAFADVVNAVTSKLGVKRFTLVGHSMGGGIAVSYALEHPAKLDQLVLIDAAGGPVSKDVSLPIAFQVAKMPILSNLMNVVTPRGFVEQSVRQSMAQQSVINDKMIDRYWELLRYPGNREATGARFRSAPVLFNATQVHTPQIPTLIMWGENDTIFPLATGQWFAANMPQAKLITYKGVGHLPMQEASDRSVQDLLEWSGTKQ
jgi:pimeloyl-ACP methyl ester carboxylesterase